MALIPLPTRSTTPSRRPKTSPAHGAFEVTRTPVPGYQPVPVPPAAAGAVEMGSGKGLIEAGRQLQGFGDDLFNEAQRQQAKHDKLEAAKAEAEYRRRIAAMKLDVKEKGGIEYSYGDFDSLLDTGKSFVGTSEYAFPSIWQAKLTELLGEVGSAMPGSMSEHAREMVLTHLGQLSTSDFAAGAEEHLRAVEIEELRVADDAAKTLTAEAVLDRSKFEQSLADLERTFDGFRHADGTLPPAMEKLRQDRIDEMASAVIAGHINMDHIGVANDLIARLGQSGLLKPTTVASLQGKIVGTREMRDRRTGNRLVEQWISANKPDLTTSVGLAALDTFLASIPDPEHERHARQWADIYKRNASSQREMKNQETYRKLMTEASKGASPLDMDPNLLAQASEASPSALANIWSAYERQGSAPRDRENMRLHIMYKTMPAAKFMSQYQAEYWDKHHNLMTREQQDEISARYEAIATGKEDPGGTREDATVTDEALTDVGLNRNRQRGRKFIARYMGMIDDFKIRNDGRAPTYRERREIAQVLTKELTTRRHGLWGVTWLFDFLTGADAFVPGEEIDLANLSQFEIENLRVVVDRFSELPSSMVADMRATMQKYGLAHLANDEGVINHLIAIQILSAGSPIYLEREFMRLRGDQ